MLTRDLGMIPLASEVDQQRRCLALIGDLLDRTVRKDLPQLGWQVARTGASVTAEADMPGLERAVFDAWARDLCLTVKPEKIWEFDGETELRAEGKVDGVYLFLRAVIRTGQDPAAQ